MNGTQLLSTEQVAKISRHAGKAAAIASNDNENQSLEPEAVGYICQEVEGSNFNKEKYHIGIFAANIVRDRGPKDTTAAV